MATHLKLKFGEARHGWYPISLVATDVDFAVIASDVLVDPVVELVRATEEACLYQKRSEAWFFLEPNFFQMILAPMDDQMNVSVYHVSNDWSEGRKVQRKMKEFEFVASTEEVLVQFWRGLKEFCSREPEYQRTIQVVEDAAKKLTSKQQESM